MKKNDFMNMSINNNLKLMVENIKKLRTQGLASCVLIHLLISELRP